MPPLSLLLDRFRRTRRRVVAAGALAAAFGLIALPASARIETLRWRHPNPAAVDGFRVYSRSVDGSYGKNSNGVERPGSLAACRPHAVVSCP